MRYENVQLDAYGHLVSKMGRDEVDPVRPGTAASCRRNLQLLTRLNFVGVGDVVGLGNLRVLVRITIE